MDVNQILGPVGLLLAVFPYGALLVRWAATRRPARRFLRLHHERRGVEVIVSTSATRLASPGEAKTYTTAVGELRAIAVGARTILGLYKRKKVSVFMSDEYQGRLQDDVLLLGGPLRNGFSGRLLDHLNRRYPSAQLVLDAPSQLIGVGGRTFEFDQQQEDGVPQEDLALLVLATAPWSNDDRQRVVLCAGLSTYGTEGAARFLFQQLLGSSSESRRLRHLLSDEFAAAVIHVTVERRQAVRAELYEDAYWSTRRAETTPKATRRPLTPSHRTYTGNPTLLTSRDR
jgi:hypothetical protein